MSGRGGRAVGEEEGGVLMLSFMFSHMPVLFTNSCVPRSGTFKHLGHLTLSIVLHEHLHYAMPIFIHRQ